MHLEDPASIIYLHSVWHNDIDAFVRFYIRLEQAVAEKLPKEKDGSLSLPQIKVEFANEVRQAIESHKNESNLKIQEILHRSAILECKLLETQRCSVLELKDKLAGMNESMQCNHSLLMEKYANSTTLPTLSSAKIGLEAERSFEETLNKSFPSASIVRTSDDTANGDFLIVRENLPNLMLELKRHKRNVPSKDVEKFERDIINRGRHGILISQSSGIVNRKPNELKLLEGKYLACYISNHDENPNELSRAIEMIDLIDKNFISQNQNQKFSLNNEDLLQIQNEIYLLQQQFAVMKMHIKTALDTANSLCIKTLQSKFSVYAQN